MNWALAGNSYVRWSSVEKISPVASPSIPESDYRRAFVQGSGMEKSREKALERTQRGSENSGSLWKLLSQTIGSRGASSNFRQTLMKEPMLAADKDALSTCSRRLDDFVVALSSPLCVEKNHVIVSANSFTLSSPYFINYCTQLVLCNINVQLILQWTYLSRLKEIKRNSALWWKKENVCLPRPLLSLHISISTWHAISE